MVSYQDLIDFVTMLIAFAVAVYTFTNKNTNRPAKVLVFFIRNIFY